MAQRRKSIRFPLVALMLCGITGIASCADDPKPRGSGSPIPPDPPPVGVPSGTVVEGGDTPEAMDALKAGWAPSFEPDYNTLEANPDVKPVSKDEADDVVVTPTQLIFSASKHPEISDWAPGRLVVSGPGAADGTGKNPLGFARRVTEIKLEGDYYVVETVLPALEELFAGEMQQTFDPDAAIEVPLDKLDLEWASKNLYQDADLISPGPDSLTDSYPVYPQGTDEFGNPLPGQPGWGFIGKAAKGVGNAIGSAAKSVGEAIGNAWVAITPASFEGTAKLGKDFSFGWDGPIFNVNANKTIGSGKFPMALSIKGKGDLTSNISFNPGVQIGMRVPNIGHKNVYFGTWLNVDSYFRAKFGLDLDLEASIASAGGKTGTALDAELNASADFAQNVLNEARNRFMGDQDVKPAGGWKKTLYITTPSTMLIAAGPVPVVITSTFQLDLECGFEAKASLKAKLEAEQAMTFKFSTSYDNGTKKLTATTPQFTNLKKRSMQVTGGGEVSLSCGLIPRQNVYLYDTVGINAGIRGSLVARAKYESKCPEPAHPTKTKPNGEISVGLYGNIGLQVGARLQAPGSSYAGTSGQVAGFDIGPIEPYNTEFEIWKQSWDVGGLGYCTPACKNLSKDGVETDIDCGNLCGKCGENKLCSVNGDCAVGYCSNGKCSATNHCGDGILDGDETGVDCGGAQCGKCANGRTCILGSDCLSGSCRVTPGSGSLLGTCVADHCQDNVKSGDETGIDCGGKCKKCDLGVVCADGAGCASGYSNGYVCVANLCSDLQKSPTETDIDCGGPQCAPCSLGKGCQAVSDCVMVSTTECQTRACDSGVCSILNTPQNTPAPGQTAGDCLLNLCDGNGATVVSNDDLDVENDNNPCTDNSCSNGMKVTNSTPANTSCGAGGNLYCDGNGTCVGCTTAAQCGTPSNECLEATCVAGVCGTQSKTNGTGCNDNNACTQADSCQAGVCVGANPVVCTALDQCHDVGMCDPMTGVCSDPNKVDGSLCTDNDACTLSETCQAGVCTIGSAVTCSALDECHDVGTCDSMTGACSNPTKADGASCENADLCTLGDTCTLGVCMLGTPMTCTLGAVCSMGMCVDDPIAYVKASNAEASDRFGFSMVLSADGNTMAVGAIGEQSNATGVNGDQNDNSAGSSGAVYVFTRSGATWVQQAYLKASNTGAGDTFGISVALSSDGNTLAVGAAYESSNATGINGDQNNNSASSAGAVYVFTRNAGTWSQQAYVKASNTGAGDQFGRIVGLSADGNTMAVGAFAEDSNAAGINGNQADNSAANAGAAYVFTRSGVVWSQQAYLKASNPAAQDNFGQSLSLSSDGNTLAVGALYEDSNATGIGGSQGNDLAQESGAAYVFTRSGSVWSQQAYVKASNTGAFDSFGHSIALSGDGNSMAIAALEEDSNATGIDGNQADNSGASSGAVYLYTRSGSVWSQQAYIKASNTGIGDYFGQDVALSGNGNMLAVGAYFEASSATGIGGDQLDNSLSQSGAAYLFTRIGGVWSQQAYVKASNTGASDRFGFDVSLSNDGMTLVTSAPQESSNATGIGGEQTDDSASQAGAVYVY